jgi:hypothetical protein
VLFRHDLYDLLRYTLRRAHDAARPHCLVGGDEHKVTHLGGESGIDHVARSGDVIGDCLDDVVLHQRYVLVGGGVKNRVWPVEVNQPLQALGVPHVGDDRHEGYVRKRPSKLPQDVEDRVLAVAEENHFRRGEAGQLPAQLTANRSAGTRDENGLAGGELGH